MEIVWLGHSCFRIRGREATVVTDPCPPASGYAIGKPTADIVTISHEHPNHAHLKAVAGSPTVVSDPGEYEIHGAFITGVTTYHDTQKGQERGKNVAFLIEMEDIKICHLGDLGHTPSADQVEEIVGCDVLLVPVSLLEAKLVIPMHYKTDALKDGLDTAERFLKEMEVKSVEPQQKLAIGRTAIPAETQVVVLDYKGQRG
jgi:L-ascorbate metabolism protein UlaG (beta-lactamase superfamily)